MQSATKCRLQRQLKVYHVLVDVTSCPMVFCEVAEFRKEHLAITFDHVTCLDQCS